MHCLFCDIAANNKPAEIVFEDDQSVAFKDIQPRAPVHILIIPRKHLGSVEEIGQTDEQLLGHLVYVAKKLTNRFQIDQTGYRLVINTRRHAGQVVDHLHLHLLGGSQLGPMVTDSQE